MSEANKSGLTVMNGAGACWSCGDQRAAQFCHACGRVQPPAPVDFFSFFGLPRKLQMDVAQLENEFYQLSRKLHPDLYAQAEVREREWSLEQTSRLNDAYRTLRDPVQRTRYLLNLEGIELEEQSKSATEKARAAGVAKKQVVPPDLLEEVFDLNMQLEELRAQKKLGEDNPALLEEIGRQRLELQEKYDGLLKELESVWKLWDSSEGQSGADRRKILDKMVDVLNRRNYIGNLVRDVNEALEN